MISNSKTTMGGMFNFHQSSQTIDINKLSDAEHRGIDPQGE